MKKVFFFTIAAMTLFACNRVEPNYEGVLMQNWGRGGLSDLSVVTGAQGMLGMSSSLYQVPMFEQTADPEVVNLTARDAGVFSVDPKFTYEAIRGKGPEIILNYKHTGVGSGGEAMDVFEAMILNPLVVNAFREEARGYTTDSLMNNLNSFENSVQARLSKEMEAKFFKLNSLTSGLKPPTSMSDAIEKRNNAIQQAQEVKNQLEVSRMKLEQARIDAEANKARAEGLDNKVLTEKYIEMLRNTGNKVIITDGKTPIILGQ